MRLSLPVILLFLTSDFVLAQQPSLKYCLTNETIAVGGYDVVSYFKTGKAVAGSPKFAAHFDRVTYYFSSQQHKNDFDKAPAKYIPQFGGWCSMTLAMGKATRPSYDNFLIREGKLYLFERTLSVNGRELWLRDPEGNARRAADTYSKYANGEVQR